MTDKERFIEFLDGLEHRPAFNTNSFDSNCFWANETSPIIVDFNNPHEIEICFDDTGKFLGISIFER